jgi:hypothetical protein
MRFRTCAEVINVLAQHHQQHEQVVPVVATLALGSRPRQGVARVRESRGKKPGSQKEGSPGAKAKALEGCGPRGSPGVITYSRESKEVRGSVRE